jgi:hypothetical protein
MLVSPASGRSLVARSPPAGEEQPEWALGLEILAAKGGLAAEVAACRARWPEPRIELVPYFYDAVSYPEPL